ncbi:MAG TPA: hypothetical protein VN637_11600, partial [Roseiarcus sp.]|nr:hypothetical protein [Roseiarcus sp.]
QPARRGVLPSRNERCQRHREGVSNETYPNSRNCERGRVLNQYVHRPSLNKSSAFEPRQKMQKLTMNDRAN